MEKEVRRVQFTERATGATFEAIVVKSTARLYVAHFAVGGRVMATLTYRPLGSGVTIQAKRLPAGSMSAAKDLASLLHAATLLGAYIEEQMAEPAAGSALIQ
jgi:hypothetical protein